MLIIAQRLVRRLCEKCKETHEVAEAALIKIGFAPEDLKQCTIYSAKGCSECNQTGYKGRVAIYEVMTMPDEIKDLILRGASPVEIKKEVIRLGMLTLRQSAVQKVLTGVTSVDELLRVTFED
jgi:type IV pilus assembly protein PilB